MVRVSMTPLRLMINVRILHGQLDHFITAPLLISATKNCLEVPFYAVLYAISASIHLRGPTGYLLFQCSKATSA